MKNTKKGFTLVELLVVIAILAILASVAVVGYTAFLDKANDSKAESELHQIVTYVDAELMDDGKWAVKIGEDTYTVERSAAGVITVDNDANADTPCDKTLAEVIKAHFVDLFPAGATYPTLSATGKSLTYTTANGGTDTQSLR